MASTGRVASVSNVESTVILDLEEAKAAQSNGEVRGMQDGLKSNYQAHQEIQPSCCEWILALITWILCIIPIFWFFMFRTVKEYERALIFRFGKITGNAKGPGLFFINPWIDTIHVVDLRIITLPLTPQKMMTKDSVTCTVDAVVFMKVSNPIQAILEVDSYKIAFRNVAATTLRGVIGKYDLETIISKRSVVNDEIRKIIEADTSSWGVKVPAVEIRDVTLPNNMQRAMAAASEAERERQAKIISATYVTYLIQIFYHFDIFCTGP